MPDIRIQGLTKHFGGQPVLQNLDLTIREGEFLTLLGASGCGKSTLLKLIAGLEQVTTGSIHLGQRDLLALSPSQRDCAMVFQSYALYPHMTVGENICTPLLMRGLRFSQRLPGMAWLSPGVRRQRAEAEATARKVAATLGIDALWSRKPAQLSGGQRQRVALARAMVRRPAVFLFDEPLSNLDANLRQTLRSEIRQLHDALGVTFVYVTHDQHEAMSMSDRIAVMRGGRILQLGTPHEIYDTPTNLEVARFVGAPRINVLQAVVGTDGAVYLLRPATALLPAGMTPRHVAFRPHAGRTLADQHSGLKLIGRVQSVEYTGAEQVVLMAVAGQADPVLICLPATQGGVMIGQMLSVYVPQHELHLFDDDGQRVAWQAAPRAAAPVLSCVA